MGVKIVSVPRTVRYTAISAVRGDEMTRYTSHGVRLRLALLGAALLAGDFVAAASNYAVLNGTVAGGGQVAEAGPFRLISTIGEPAMGTTAGGQYRLTSGFPATIGNTVQGGPGGDRIFQNGFED